MAFGSDKNRRTRELEDTLDKDPVGWLGPGIEVEGKLKFSAGMVRLNAKYKGEIIGEGTLVVDDQGDLEAEIHARIITIAGKVKGTVHASERIEIKEHGVILGDMYTPSLVIDPGGFFDGQCHMPTPEGLAKQLAQKPADQGPA
jgi:cytoskeletal protein CcmA (bactofilin family)